jgi:hypothetical protein
MQVCLLSPPGRAQSASYAVPPSPLSPQDGLRESIVNIGAQFAHIAGDGR